MIKYSLDITMIGSAEFDHEIIKLKIKDIPIEQLKSKAELIEKMYLKNGARKTEEIYYNMSIENTVESRKQYDISKIKDTSVTKKPKIKLIKWKG